MHSVCSSLKGHSSELDFFWGGGGEQTTHERGQMTVTFPQNGRDATAHQSTDWARCCFLSERKKEILMKIFIYLNWEG